MKNIILILSLFLVSCGEDSVTLTKEEYKQLIGDTIKPEYPKKFNFRFKDRVTDYYDWVIILGEDNHEYLRNGGGNSLVLIHYPDCKLCKQDTVNH